MFIDDKNKFACQYIVHMHITAELKAYWLLSFACICRNVVLYLDYNSSAVEHTYAMWEAYLPGGICQLCEMYISIVGLCQSWLTMDVDNLSITCPDCLLSLSSASCGCRDQCDSGNLGHIGHIYALTLVCWLLCPFCRLTSLLPPLSASFYQSAAVCEACFSSWCSWW